LCVAGGILAGLTIRNPRRAVPEPAVAPERAVLHCGLACPPPRTDQSVTPPISCGRSFPLVAERSGRSACSGVLPVHV
ncbi:MAG: hypothetical protein ACTHJW_22680, partial [Streptosporangiaceae bacterium]